MQLLADENIPRPLLAPLRHAGHDVVHIADGHRGLPDIDVLALASDQNRVLMTEDKGFGELIFRHGLSVPGVIFIRMDPTDIPGKIKALADLIGREGDQLRGRYTVLEGEDVRIRPLLRWI